MGQGKRDRQVKITGGLWDAFRQYKKEKIIVPVDRKMYVDVCHELNKRISTKIIKESFDFRIPFRLGFLRIKSQKQKIFIKDGRIDSKKMSINWNETVKMWKEDWPDKTMAEIKQIPNKKLVYHTNEHSNGYIMKWYWDRRLAKVKNITVYTFRPVKGNVYDEEYYTGKVGLAKWIKSDERNNEYYM